MIYKFRLISNEQEGFFCDIEIKSSQTFFDFHYAIQDVFGYDKSQLASFFITNEKWEKQQEITLLDMSHDESSEDVIVMDKAVLYDFIFEEKQKMIYVFDFFSERAFFIELVEISEKEKDVSYPVCTNLTGDIPQQIKISDRRMDDIFEDEYEDETGKDDIFESPDDYEEFQ